MKYQLTMTVEISVSGGQAKDMSAWLAKTIKRRLSEAHGGRYVFAGEVVASTIERLVEDETGDRHTIATLHLNSLKTTAVPL